MRGKSRNNGILRFGRLSWGLTLGVILNCGQANASLADTALADNWKDKIVTISVGYKAGGGADIMARLLAVHLPKFVPGSPRVTVQNRPGGGTLTNARDMLRRPADGTYIGQFSQSLMVAGVLGQAPEWFNWKQYGYLGMVDGAGEATFTAVCGRIDKMKNLKDFLAGKNWRWGEISSATSAGKDLVWFSMTKFPIRAFFGYGGSVEVAAAFERGEMDVTSRCNETTAKRYPHWFKDNQVVPLFGWGELNPDKHIPPDNALSNGIRQGRWPWFGDMHKTLRHLATDDQWAALDAILALNGTHVWTLPPGVSAPVIKVLQTAFLDAIRSPGFIADMTKRDRHVAPLSGAETMKRIQTVQELSPAGKAVLVDVFKQTKKKKKKK